MEKTGFYCKKCNSVPLIQIVPKEKDIKIFCSCQCHKQLIDYELFMKIYYKKDLDYSKISNEPIYKEYIDPSPRYYNKIEIDINKINTDFNYIIEKITEFNLEVKDKIIEILNSKINEIEKLYEQNKSNNIKLQNIVKIIINNYKSNEKNSSNIKNLFFNKNFNMGYLNETHSTLNFNNYNKNYIGLDSLVKNACSYLKKNYILSSYNEQLSVINTFFNHSKEATCITEIGPEIIASCSKDSYIILYNLERKKCIYKFKAHEGEVNWINKINGKNLISCGSDLELKLWPKIDKDNLELVNSEKNGSSQTIEINIKPIISFKLTDAIRKFIIIDNNYISGCSLNNVFLIKYEIIENKSIDNNIIDDLEAKFTISEKIGLDKVFDLLKITNKKNEILLAVHGFSKLYFLSFPQLKIIREIENKNNEKISDSLTQLNENEILLSNRNYLKILDINKFQFKIKISLSGATFLSKLKDNTIIVGIKDGIKRIYPKNLEEISLIIKIYHDPFSSITEYFNHVYEFSDGRIAICSSYGNIKMCKFKIA